MGAEIWAIGGGKGGTGKTFTATALAHELAGRGYRVILLDADLGGANAHSYFALNRPRLTLARFFLDHADLESLLVPTDIPHLLLIPGDQSGATGEHVNQGQKARLIRHIRQLTADYVLLDLGAGISHFTLDLFLMADLKLAVTQPDLPSAENLFHFIKHGYLRLFGQVLGQAGIRETARNLWKERKEHHILSLPDLMGLIGRMAPREAAQLQEHLGGFQVFVILNRVRNRHEALQGYSLRSLCQKFLGVQALFPGHIGHDDQIAQGLSLTNPSPRPHLSPRISREIALIAQNCMHRKQMPMEEVKYV